MLSIIAVKNVVAHARCVLFV